MTHFDNIILVGPMGAGKTTLGRKLAQHLGMSFIDVDEYIEARLGVSVQTIFDTEGEAGFRQREAKMLKAILVEHNQTIIATGGGCVLTESCRQMIAGQRLVIHVDVSIEQQYARLKMDKKRPILQGGCLQKKLETLREQRHAIYQSLADIHLNTDHHSLRELITKISHTLR